MIFRESPVESVTCDFGPRNVVAGLLGAKKLFPNSIPSCVYWVVPGQTEQYIHIPCLATAMVVMTNIF